MAKIRTLHLHERGKERSTSFGKIKFDENGIAELPDDQAQKLVNASYSLVFVESQEPVIPDETTGTSKDENIDEINKEPELPETKSDEVKPLEPQTTTATPPPHPEPDGKQAVEPQDSNDITSESTDNNEVKKELQAMTMPEIREMLVEAGVDEAEINKPEFKGKDGKPALIDFAISILTKE